MGEITAAIGFDMAEATEPSAPLVLDTPAGPVTGHAVVNDGSVISAAYSSPVLIAPEIGG